MTLGRSPTQDAARSEDQVRLTRVEDPLSTMRRLMLALVLVGTLGLVAELLLLEHTESWTQWIPLVLLAIVFVVGAMAWVRPTRPVLRALQLTMALCIIAGIAGFGLHYWGNVQFELEGNPSARGWDLLWQSLHGGVPTLAPGAMVQLGLLGLLHAFRHPAVRD